MRPPARAARASSTFVSLLAFLTLLFAARSASAYPWMIRHEYTACIQCHLDPAGGGLLTEYGRGQGETLLRTHYSAVAADDEPGKVKDFMWGAFSLPEWLLLGGSLRPAIVVDKAGSGSPVTTPVVMEADLRAGIRAGGFRASGSLGVVSTSGSLASIKGPLVSREHWAGYSWGDDAFLVRAGRMNLPFGIRTIEHPAFVRSRWTTRTDIDDGQQHGVAFDYSGSLFRAGVMGVLGNYQISPDAFRDRGYAGFVEIAPTNKLSIGLSSLITYAQKDLVLGVGDLRQVHGAYVRAAPVKALVLMAEGDVLVNSANADPFPPGAPGAPPAGSPTSVSSVGFASLLMADVEPVQGLHLIAIGETLSPGGNAPQSSYGVWGSVHWFFAPHADFRVDTAYHRMATATAPPPGAPGAPPAGTGGSTYPDISIVAQIHVYL